MHCCKAFEQQVKQNCKHAAHLLDLHDHFVVPVDDILVQRIAADLENLVVGRMMERLEVEAVDMSLVVKACRMVNSRERNEVADRMPLELHHNLDLDIQERQVDDMFVARRRSLSMVEVRTFVDSLDILVVSMSSVDCEKLELVKLQEC